jgi:hypothetical protein
MQAASNPVMTLKSTFKREICLWSEIFEGIGFFTGLIAKDHQRSSLVRKWLIALEDVLND